MATTNEVKTEFKTFTVTIATPAVFSYSAHGLTAGTSVLLFTSGLLPTGLANGTPYYVIAGGLTAGSFTVATSKGGGAVATSGSQSGTHKYLKLDILNEAQS